MLVKAFLLQAVSWQNLFCLAQKQSVVAIVLDGIGE